MSDNSTRVRKGLLVGIDGLLFRKVGEVAAPTLRRLMDEATFAESRIYPDGETMTVSGPGWSTITTGTWPAKHGVLDNDMNDHRLADYPDLLTRAVRAGRRTFSVAGWRPITDTIIGAEVEDRRDYSIGTDWAAADRAAVDSACAKLRDEDPDLAFVYIGHVDEAGHAFGAVSEEYARAVEFADGQLSRVLAAVEARSTYAAEDWLVVVTTDHGHRPEGGHGGQSDDERSTFVITRGSAVDQPAAARMALVDIAPTLLTHVGVAVAAGWELDGRSVLLNGAAPA